MHTGLTWAGLETWLNGAATAFFHFFSKSEDVGDWSQFGQLIAVIVSAGLIYFQIKQQTRVSLQEVAFDGFHKFNEHFQKAASLRRKLMAGYLNKDYSINRESVLAYFTDYWRLNLEEWEFFRAGLLSTDTYVPWLCFAYNQIADQRELHYFDDDHHPRTLSSRDIFEDMFFVTSYRNHVGFADFFHGIYMLGAVGGKPVILPDDQWLPQIRAYVEAYKRSENIKDRHGFTPAKPRRREKRSA